MARRTITCADCGETIPNYRETRTHRCEAMYERWERNEPVPGHCEPDAIDDWLNTPPSDEENDGPSGMDSLRDMLRLQ